MTDLKSISAATIDGQDVSLQQFFQLLNLKGMMRPMIREVVTDTLVTAAARREGCTVSKEELQKAADTFRLRRRLNKAEETTRWLQANRMTQDDLESGLERTLLQRKLIGKLTGGNIEKHFAENRGRFDRARISRIVVKDEGLANEIASQIQDEGADFTELAKQHSIDRRSGTANERGVVVPRSRLPGRIAQAVFNAKLGGVVGPFPVGETHHVIQVHEIRLGELNGRTKALISRDIFRRWLGEQMRQAKIEVKLADLLS